MCVSETERKITKNKCVQTPLFRCDPNMIYVISPKKFTLREISVKDATIYNSLWHSRLPYIPGSNIYRNKHYCCLGAFYKCECYAVAILSSPVSRHLDHNTILELRRLAISQKSPKNTATWMLGKIIKYIKYKFPEIKKVISYQDTEVHKGTIYKASNWFVDGYTKGADWNISRDRRPSQSTADKIRWATELLK